MPSRSNQEAVDTALDSRETRLTVPQVASAPRSRVRPVKNRKHGTKRRLSEISTQDKRSPIDLKIGTRAPAVMGKHLPQSVFENLQNWGGGTDVAVGGCRCAMTGIGGCGWMPSRSNQEAVARRWTRERLDYQFRRSAAPQGPGFDPSKIANMGPNAGGVKFRPRTKGRRLI